ncbi:MAG: hypothetical protein OXI43_18930 [Candidatus Poribacteria bacterium]|nr:hypothetical protein [Candidatus Poribacteria bacterium]
MKNRIFHKRNQLNRYLILIITILSVVSLISCDEATVFGRNIYYNNNQCTLTEDETTIYFTCKIFSKIDFEEGEPVYYGSIAHIDDVYDADTISRVLILFHEYESGPMLTDLDAWPGLQKREDGIYIITNIRVQGVDAAEIERSKKYPEEERDRAKERGFEARDYLRSLVEESLIDDFPLTIEIRNPDFGSYPRRTVADVYLHINGERISVAEKLFETRYAVPFSFDYDFQWGQPELDFESWYRMLGIDDPVTPDIDESIPENE